MNWKSATTTITVNGKTTAIDDSNIVVINGEVVSPENTAATGMHEYDLHDAYFDEINIDVDSTSKVKLSVGDTPSVRFENASCSDVSILVDDGKLSVESSTPSLALAVVVPEKTYDRVRVATIGNIAVEDVGAVELVCETMSGDIRITRTEFLRCKATTLSGNISIDFEALMDTHVEIESMSGNIELFPHNIGVSNVACNTMSGQIAYDRREPAENEIVLSGNVETMSGNIEVG